MCCSASKVRCLPRATARRPNDKVMSMSKKQSRIDLRIDVLDLEDQHAVVLTNLKPPELVEAIVAEFHGDVNAQYLGANAADYYLVNAENSAILDSETPVGQQVANNGRLALQEIERPLPSGGRSLKHIAYLRELASGNVYKLRWQPAIVGRFSEDLPMNELVAVDLQSYPTGLRVSRRHVAITETDGQFFVENLSKNPVSIRRGDDVIISVESRKQQIAPGDVIDLERSDIMLKLIVRNGAPPDPVDAPAAEEPDENEEEN